ncbi:5-(carboxyamino)imidazole ribonucleotide synthase [Arenicella xantha]|uniref:N5-carboxyaminoimidazole ribonucleotide synthase n=1 Tax=Arenicella xantha TaxID=644221 RepID=A0A395JQG1_9GAMM|nr:5-(carboxyamino)imidazole ribonucleotide synthase [Arenicella xantha]RBP51714.1 5-(carboxyamino)imidazole ribonucleotide synthase [Arenicella xantha]
MSVVILGSGQLAKMLAEAGTKLNLPSVFVITPEISTDPVAGLGEVLRHESSADAATLLAELDSVDAVTVETENTSSELLALLSTNYPVRPNTASVVACQNRENERQLLDDLAIPTAPHQVARNNDEFVAAVASIGFPLVIKTLTEGYDGRGQWVIDDAEQWRDFNKASVTLPVLVEEKIHFAREVSLVGVRSIDGSMQFYPLAENVHVGGILIASFAPASNVSEALQQQAHDNLSKIMTHLDYVGVMAMECFETEQGLLVNELAPRVHNSGHWTLDSNVTSQFENHMRAITGLPLGTTDADGPTLMLNILGEIPDGVRDEKCQFQLYDYQKTARAGRKVGHLNLRYANAAALLNALQQLETVWKNPFIQQLIAQLED